VFSWRIENREPVNGIQPRVAAQRLPWGDRRLKGATLSGLRAANSDFFPNVAFGTPRLKVETA
jgi:hypothetical protein